MTACEPAWTTRSSASSRGFHRTASTIADFVDFDDFILRYEDPKGKTKVNEGVEEGDKAGSSRPSGDE